MIIIEIIASFVPLY